MQTPSVMHVITGLGTGGAEAMLCKLLDEIGDPEKHCVVSLTSGGKNKRVLETLGYTVLEMQLSKPWLFPFKLMQLWRLKRTQNASILHAWMYHACLFCSILSVLTPFSATRVIWNIRHSLSNLSHEKASLQRVIKVMKLFAFNPVAVVFNAHTSYQQHREYWALGSKWSVVPNGFNTDILHPWRESQESRQQQRLKNFGVACKKVIGHIGRVHDMKNHQGLIRAFGKVGEQYKDVVLVLIGKGTDKLKLSLDSSRVICLGERDDIAQLMPLFDYFVLASNYGEGFPNVIGEAMSCGIVCATTDVGDSAILVGDMRFVVPPFDNEQLVKLLTSILSIGESEVHRISEHNRNKIINNFSIKSITNQYQKLHQKVLS